MFYWHKDESNHEHEIGPPLDDFSNVRQHRGAKDRPDWVHSIGLGLKGVPYESEEQVTIYLEKKRKDKTMNPYYPHAMDKPR